jgi:excisionase family DNA binding protein
VSKTSSDVVSPEEAGRRLGLCRNAIYAGMHDGTIPCARVGRRILILRQPFEEMLRTPTGTGGVQPMPPRKVSK